MAAASSPSILPELTRPSDRGTFYRSLYWCLGVARRRPYVVPFVALSIFFAFCAAFPGLFAPQSPTAQNPSQILDGPSSDHYFGTDNFGRDVLSRVAFGARSSLLIGVGAVAISVILATTVGALTGMARGWVDLVFQRLIDALMALPWLVLLISIMALLGPGRTNTLVVIGILSAPALSRVVRSSVLRIMSLQYIEAARASGCGNLRLLGRHILPNVAPELIVLGSVGIGTAILTESALSFLGYGVVPPEPSWGYMLGIEGRRFLTTAPWLAIFPGIAIALAVLTFNVLGDALRDELDPRMRGV